MRRWVLCLFAAAFLVPLFEVEAKGKVPVRLAQARYIVLGFDTGDGFVSEQEALTSPKILPEERYLLEAIRDEIGQWGQYVVVERRKDAELMLGVRLGRLASIGGGGRVGTGSAGSSSGGSFGGEIASPYDLLTVWDKGGAILWRAQAKGALNGTPPAAFVEFRTDVERVAEKKAQDAAPAAPRE